MNFQDKTILVFGATGQQGGSVARALRSQGWPVRALVRNSSKAQTLVEQGIEIVEGNFEDTNSLRDAITGAYGVFSVQPSSGQGAAYGISDDDEVRYGKTIADLAAESGVQHLVYSSTVAAGSTKTGMGHFDTKSEIEAYIRGLNILSTIVRPATFMEILALPGMGLDKGTFSFFMRPDQPMQFIAVEDIGKIVAAIFAKPTQFGGQTLEIAGDSVTGRELAEKFSRTANKTITYSRFSDDLLQQNPFLGGAAQLVDEGRLAGHADITWLQETFPELLTVDQWLASEGKKALLKAIQTDSGELALR